MPPFGLGDVKRAFREVALRVHPTTAAAMSQCARRSRPVTSSSRACPATRRHSRERRSRNQTDVPWRRSAKGEPHDPAQQRALGTIFKTALGDYKYVTRNDFSARSFATEDAAAKPQEEVGAA